MKCQISNRIVASQVSKIMSQVEEIEDFLGDDIFNRNIDDNLDEIPEAEENNEASDESTSRKVEVKKRVARAPLPKLNAQRLSGPKGIISIDKHFEHFKFKGKHHEKDDLNKVMIKLELWAHRLFPKYQFDDCLERIERLGKQRVIMSYMNMYRLNTLQPEADEKENLELILDERNDVLATPLDEMDEFLNEQITLAKSRDTFHNEAAFDALINSPSSSIFGSSPKPTSTPNHTERNVPADNIQTLTEEQKNIIALNRQKAREMLMQKAKANNIVM